MYCCVKLAHARRMSAAGFLSHCHSHNNSPSVIYLEKKKCSNFGSKNVLVSLTTGRTLRHRRVERYSEGKKYDQWKVDTVCRYHKEKKNNMRVQFVCTF